MIGAPKYQLSFDGLCGFYEDEIKTTITNQPEFDSLI